MPIRSLELNLDVIVAVLGFFLVAGYYALLYRKTRRRSTAPIALRQEPPEGMCAVSVQYLVDKAHDAKTMTIMVMELISIRAMRIDKDGLTPKLKSITRTPLTRQRLARDGILATTAEKLFNLGVRKPSAKESGRSRLRGARYHMRLQLSERWEKLIDRRRALSKRGIYFWVLYLACCLIVCRAIDNDAGLNSLIITLYLLPIVATISFCLIDWLSSRAVDPDAARNAGKAVAFNIVPLAAVELWMLGSVTPGIPPHLSPTLLPVLLVPLVVWSYRFTQGYTKEGDQVMDQIAGFKRYLTSAEGPRLPEPASVEKKLLVYESYLPYAVALGVGRQWADAFRDLAATAEGQALFNETRKNYGGNGMMVLDYDTGMSGVRRDLDRIAGWDKEESDASDDDDDSSDDSGNAPDYGDGSSDYRHSPSHHGASLHSSSHHGLSASHHGDSSSHHSDSSSGSSGDYSFSDSFDSGSSGDSGGGSSSD